MHHILAKNVYKSYRKHALWNFSRIFVWRSVSANGDCSIQAVNQPVNQHRRQVKSSQHILHCVSKNAPTLASCCFDKHGLISIILGKQHQHTFRNHMHFQLSLSLHFCLHYLLLSSCDGWRWWRRLLVAVKRVGASEKSRFYFGRCSKWCPFSFTHAHNRFFHGPSFVDDVLWHACPCVGEALLQVAGVASFPSQLLQSKCFVTANKVSKSKGTRQVEYA